MENGKKRNRVTRIEASMPNEEKSKHSAIRHEGIDDSNCPVDEQEDNFDENPTDASPRKMKQQGSFTERRRDMMKAASNRSRRDSMRALM